MNSEQFNKKYSLSPKLTKFLKRKNNNGDFKTAIAGEPKKMWKEATKRFFKNPVSSISVILFFTIILMGIILPLVSPYLAKKVIYDGNIANIKDLPPFYVKTKVLTLTPAELADNEYYKNINTWISDPIYGDYFKSLLNYEEKMLNANTYRISYDYVNYFKISKVWQQIIEAKEQGQNLSLDQVTQIFNGIVFKRPILGTDENGHDIWTTSWYSTWNSIKIALIVATFETIIGVAVGAFLGFHAGKWIDTVVMRIIEIFLSPPSIVWLLLFVTILGTSDLTLIISLIFVGWAGPVSRTRMFIITVKDEEYIIASKSVGARKGRLIFLHALPAILGKIATSYVRSIPTIIMSVASLSFLGFFKSDSANLGQVLIDANSSAENNIWTLALPCFILLSISLSLHFISLGVHDSLDPRVMTNKK